MLTTGGLLLGLVSMAPTVEASHQPLIWPHSGYITTPYHTYRSSCSCYHDAVDISDDKSWGDPIVAAYTGTVSYVCSGWCGGYGNYVLVNHANGYQTLYAHLQDYVVSVGQAVQQGQLLGHEGSTGNSTGPHLHFEVRKNGVKQYIPGSSWAWVTRGNRIPQHYDLNDLTDNTPPTTSASLDGTRGDNGWWRSAVTVRLSASDAGSGVDFTKFRIDGGGWATYGGAFSVSGDGGHTVSYYSVDRAGKTESAKSVSFSIDTRPPVTSPALSGTPGNEGWWRSTVTVTLSATDATSGVASTRAVRDGAAFAYSGPFGVAGDGAHAVAFDSTDRAGNREAQRSFALHVDGTAPATTLGFGTPAHASDRLYVSSATPFTLAAVDATSGVRGSAWAWRGDERAYAGTFRLSGADGESSVSWRSEDRAGNFEAWKARAFFLDNTPPAAELRSPPEGAIIASLGPTRVEAGATDAGSGVARVEFLVDGVLRSVDAAAPYEWDWSVGDEALGEHLVEVRAVDFLGHATVRGHAVTTVPTSKAGVEATAARVQAVAEERVARGPPTVGVVVEYDTEDRAFRIGTTVDGEFHGAQGQIPA